MVRNLRIMLCGGSFYTHILDARSDVAALLYHVSIRFGDDGIKVDGDEIEIGIKSEPERGRVNRELVKKLAGQFGVPVQNVKIVSGHSSRKKLVAID